MKASVPLILLLLAAIATSLSIFGEGGFTNLSALRRSVEIQRQRNSDVRESVESMKQEVHRIESDPRALEKAARNELGLARPNEIVVVFDEESKE